MITTIKIQEATKGQLDHFRENVHESYDEVIKKVIYIASSSKHNPKLSQETVIAIENARERYKKGHYLSESAARKKLGL